MAQIVGYFSNGNPIYMDDFTQKSVFINCDFRHSKLSGLDLNYISFFQCDFTRSSLRESKFNDVVFSSCVLDEVDAFSAHFIGCVFGSVSMQHSLLTKAKFIIKDWQNVDISGSKIFDMEIQETKDSGICIMGYQSDVVGEPKVLLNGYFTVDSDTAWARGFGIDVKRITNRDIESLRSKTLTRLRRILGIKTRYGDDVSLKNIHYEFLQINLDKIRKK
jgi:uncharacterized protein YjbI with pentapeptide repeats